MAEAEATLAPAIPGDNLASLNTGHLVSDPGAVFAEQSHLAYLVPPTTDLDLEDLFKDIAEGSSIIDSIKQRDSLFFGTAYP